MAAKTQLEQLATGTPGAPAKTFTPNATYAKEPVSTVDLVGAAIDLIVSSAEFNTDGMPTSCGATVAVQGTHGTGKTSAAKAAAAARGFNIVYLSAPVLDITALYCSFPYKTAGDQLTADQTTKVKTILHRLFNQDTPWVLVIDDFRRVQPSAQGAMFELMNEGTLSGQDLRGHVGTLLIDNPAGDGYMGVGGGDPAFETRFHTVEVDANGTPWRRALAAKYSDTNLKDLFEAWSSWDPTVRRTINPRVLDHLIGVTLEGLPPEIGLPILPSGRQKVLDAAGTDVTTRILTTVAERLGVSYRDRIDNLMGRSLEVAVRRGWNVHMVGPHAVGKTATIRTHLEEIGVDAAYLSMAHQTPADLLVTVPTGDGGIEVIPNERLVADGKTTKVIVCDEMFRAGANVKGQMLEMFQERSLGGTPLGVAAVFALNNPAKWGDFTYPVGKADEALCSRFEINLFVDADSTPWKGYLQGKYSDDVVNPFLEWRAHSLSDTERAICAPRVMEKLIQVYVYNLSHPDAALPLETALPMGADGRRVPVRLHDLNRRLAGAMVLGFSRIIMESDRILAELRTDTGGDAAAESRRLNLENEVTRALQNAELFELETRQDLCAELIMACASNVRIAIFRSAKSAGDSSERQMFWAKIASAVQEAKNSASSS